MKVSPRYQLAETLKILIIFFFEGLGCILAGMIGSGNGTTSYSENIGEINF